MKDIRIEDDKDRWGIVMLSVRRIDHLILITGKPDCIPFHQGTQNSLSIGFYWLLSAARFPFPITSLWHRHRIYYKHVMISYNISHDDSCRLISSHASTELTCASEPAWWSTRTLPINTWMHLENCAKRPLLLISYITTPSSHAPEQARSSLHDVIKAIVIHDTKVSLAQRHPHGLLEPGIHPL